MSRVFQPARNPAQVSPNGAASSSPGLARRLPWEIEGMRTSTLKGLWHGAAHAATSDATPLGLMNRFPFPRVGAGRHPWAGGRSPVGAGARSTPALVKQFTGRFEVNDLANQIPGWKPVLRGCMA